MRGVEESNVERAMFFLAESDGPIAEAKVAVERAEILRKRVRARVYLSESGTVEERKAKAEVAADAESADVEYLEAITTYEELRAKRQRAELVIELYRTLEASRRRAA